VKRLAVLSSLSVLALVVLAGPAGAHVTVDPSSAPKGSDAVLAFTVPNEMDNARTTKVVIAFPADHPILDATTEPIAGWTARVEHTRLSKPVTTDDGTFNEYVSRVTWTGGSIGVGQFQQFKVAMGLPDDTDSLVFKALQTYSNGQTVRWIEVPSSADQEPQNPAPTLTLTAADTSTKSSDSDSNALAIIALVVGAVGVLVGGAALLRARSQRS
jgi:uncharacterized protein YcnI